MSINKPTHVNDDASSGKNFLHAEIFRLLIDRRVAGATLHRVQAGFDTHHRMHRRSLRAGWRAPGSEIMNIPEVSDRVTECVTG